MIIRVLAVSDLHQSRELYHQLSTAVKLHQPRVVAVIGDLLHCGDQDRTMLNVSEAAAHLCNLPVEHLVIVRGNHEESNWQEFLDCWPHFRRPFHALYGSYVCFGPLMIVGFPCELGWEDPWRHTLPRSGTGLPCVSWLLGRKRLVANPRKWLDPLYKRRGPAAGTLWLMHEPPTDRTISTPVAGNRQWNQLVQTFRPQLTVSGHCHEVPRQGGWFAAIGATICVNVGQGVQELHYSIIDFDFDSSFGPILPNRITVEAFPGRKVITIEGCKLHPVGEDQHNRGEVLLPDALKGSTRQLIGAEGGALPQSVLELHRNITSDDVAKLVESSELIGWRDESGYHFPLWQFDRDGSILPGLPEVLKTVRPFDCWEAMKYLLEPLHSLDGARPLDLLRQGQVAPILRAAEKRR